MKRTYINRLPKNEEVKNTNVRIENGELIVEVDFNEKFQPKDGDFLVINGGIFIYNPNSKAIHIGLNGYYVCMDFSKKIYIYENGGYDGFGSMYDEEIRYSTIKEKADFLERLEKEFQKRWNAETKQLEDIRWIPNINEHYYYVDSRMCIGKIYNVQSVLDKEMIEKGNCFKTVESAQKVADQIKEIFKNSKAE